MVGRRGHTVRQGIVFGEIHWKGVLEASGAFMTELYEVGLTVKGLFLGKEDVVQL